jgi:transposase
MASSNDTAAFPMPSRHTYYCGIDIGFNKHALAAIPIGTFLGARGEAWRRAAVHQFTSDAKRFEALQRNLDKCSTDPADFLFVMEPTGGNYGLALLQYVQAGGYEVVLVDNAAVHEYKKLSGPADTKTDPVDARVMARMGYLHENVGGEFKIRPVQQGTTDRIALRVMVNDHLHVQIDINRHRKQLGQIIAVTFPELRLLFKDSTTSPTARAILVTFPTPADIVTAGVEQVRQVLQARAYPHSRRADELIALAQQTVGVEPPSRLLGRQAWLLNQIQTLEGQRDELVARLVAAIADNPCVPSSKACPVRSTICTASLLAAFGTDVTRFETEAEFRAYAGWFPKLDQSGKSVNGTVLSHRGVRLPRRTLWEMTGVMVAPRD